MSSVLSWLMECLGTAQIVGGVERGRERDSVKELELDCFSLKPAGL